MKPVLLPLLISLLLTVASAGQTAKSLDGFLDIPWGTSREQARQLITAKTGTSYHRTQENTLVFRAGTFAGRPANAFSLWFVGDRLYQGNAILPAGSGRTLFDALKKELTAKYGPPTASGKITRWSFPATAFHKEAEVLELAEHEAAQIRVSYINESLRQASGAKDDL